MKNAFFSLFAVTALSAMPLGAVEYFINAGSGTPRIDTLSNYRIWDDVEGEWITPTTLPGAGDLIVWRGDFATGAFSLTYDGSRPQMNVLGLDFRSGVGGYQTLSMNSLLGIGAGGLTIASNSCDVTATHNILLTANQTWTIGAGRTLTLSSFGDTAVGDANAGKTVTLAGAGTLFLSGNYSNMFGGANVKVQDGFTIMSGNYTWNSNGTWELLGYTRICSGSTTFAAHLNPSLLIQGNATLGLSSEVAGVSTGLTDIANAAGKTITGGGNLTLVNADGSGMAWARIRSDTMQLASVTVKSGVTLGFTVNVNDINHSGVVYNVESGGTLGFARLSGANSWSNGGPYTVGAVAGAGQIFGNTLVLDGAGGTHDLSGNVVLLNGTTRMNLSKTGAATQKFTGASNDFGTVALSGGKLVIGGATSVTRYAGSLNVSGGSILEVNGTMNQLNTSTIGISLNGGTMQVNGTFNAVPGTERSDTSITNGGHLLITDGGKFIHNGTGGYISFGSADSAGFVTVKNGGSLVLGVGFTAYKDSIFTVEGSFSGAGGTVNTDATLIVGKNATYTGSGTTTVHGTLRTTAGGATMQGALVSMGAGGVLDVGHRLSFKNGLTLAGNASGGTRINFSSEDAIVVAGAGNALALGNSTTNKITLNLTGGCWVFGDKDDAEYIVNIFDISGSATGYSGTWSDTSVNLLLNGAALPAGTDIEFGAGGGYLFLKGVKYVPIPEPSTWALFGAGLAWMALARRRRG